MTYISALDLGQSQDFSALVTCKVSGVPDAVAETGTANRFDVRHILRWPLRTSYPAIVADLKGMYDVSADLHGSTLVIDGTGVGRAVVDMVKESGISADVRAYTITAGYKEGDGTVPKADLVAAVQAALQTRRLRFARALELRETLEKELEMFRVKVTADRNETFAAWREKDHDDLVLALALAVWYGERHGGDQSGCYSTATADPLRRLPPGTFARKHR